MDRVVELWRVTDKIICFKMELHRFMLNVVSAYAPEVGCIHEKREALWLNLDDQWKRYQRMKELWWEQT